MKNKIVLMCGSHMRHLFIADTLKKENRLAALVVEQREDFIPEPPARLSERDKANFILHFSKRDESEKKFFGHVKSQELFMDIPVLHTTMDQLNSKTTEDFLRKYSDCIMITYGVHIVKNNILSMFPNKSFNIHGGLSPWYRGNTTLFWPFYFLKPNWAGMTIHRLSEKLDGGDILHHSVPELAYGDSMHDVASKAVVKVAEDLCSIMNTLDNGGELLCYPQTGSGKLFLSRDWTPEMLRMIYEVYEDKIVDLFLDGILPTDEPDLVNALK